MRVVVDVGVDVVGGGATAVGEMEGEEGLR